MKDLFGKALLDFHRGTTRSPLMLFNEYGDPEEIPVESYFYGPDQFSNLEIFALDQCKGRVLDIGAASGRHALYIQNQGIDITALDISQACGKLMRETGVKKVVVDDIFKYRAEKYDTIIMLMNGLGVVGTLGGLQSLLDHLKTLLVEDGQLIVDSSDISYLYDDDNMPEGKYFGELSFQYSYGGQLDDSFNWLYIDPSRLMQLAGQSGWNCQIIYEDQTGSFLARLKMHP